jgi:hypothetical protein
MKLNKGLLIMVIFLVLYARLQRPMWIKEFRSALIETKKSRPQLQRENCTLFLF